MKRCAALCAAVTLLALAPAARAEPNDSATRAIELGRSALQHYQRGELKEALSELEAAEQHMHSPVFLLYRARCHRDLLQYRRALQELLQLRDESLAPDAPRPFFEARTAAGLEAEQLSSQIPTLRVNPTIARADVTLHVDGGMQRFGDAIPLDPGLHVVEVHEGDQVLQRRSVELRASQRHQLVAEVPSPLSQAQPAPSKSNPMLKTVPRVSAARERAALTALGLGSASVVVGVITGILAWQERSAANCHQDDCNESERDRIQRGRLLANVSTVGFATGAIGLATGGLIWGLLPAGAATQSGQILVQAQGRF